MVGAKASCTQDRCTACLALAGRRAARIRGVRDLDDFVQDLFARLWREGAWAVPTQRGCQECLCFIGVVARRQAISWQRRWARTLAREVSLCAVGDADALPAHVAPEVDVAEEAMQRLLTSSIKQHLMRLTPWQQTVILLRFRDGLSAADMATTTGASADAVRQALHRAIVALRAALHEDAPPRAKSVAANARPVAQPEAIPRSALLSVTLWCARAIRRVRRSRAASLVWEGVALKTRVFLAAWAMFLGASLAAIALDCYGDPREPEIRNGGKCYEGRLYVYCTDDELVRDGACKVATTGAADCTVSNYRQYHTWKPKHPGYLGFGYCADENDCEKENSYWSHVATNSGICQVTEE